MTLRRISIAVCLVALVAVVACGGGEPAEAPVESSPEAPAAGGAPDLSNAGDIAGSVSFVGTPPEAPPVQMDADPFCLAAHADAVNPETVVVGEGGTLGNVIVYVKEGIEGFSFPTPTESVVLTQQGCVYIPHVVAMHAGQTIVIRNGDDTLHNVNAQPTNNPAFNIGQPVRGMETERTFEIPEIGIPVRCDVHPWMASFISVFDHPYFVATANDGAFSLGELPPGDYVVEAWHEVYGAQAQNVTVAPNETAEISFTFGG